MIDLNCFTQLHNNSSQKLSLTLLSFMLLETMTRNITTNQFGKLTNKNLCSICTTCGFKITLQTSNGLKMQRPHSKTEDTMKLTLMTGFLFFHSILFTTMKNIFLNPKLAMREKSNGLGLKILSNKLQLTKSLSLLIIFTLVQELSINQLIRLSRFGIPSLTIDTFSFTKNIRTKSCLKLLDMIIGKTWEYGRTKANTTETC